VRYGVKVVGLLTAVGPRSAARPHPATGMVRVPRVTGVRTDRGGLPADLVVDATGRRSPVDDWLAQIGARPTAT
jgi:hypothetical protein